MKCSHCGRIIHNDLAGLVDHHAHYCPHRPVKDWAAVLYRKGANRERVR